MTIHHVAEVLDPVTGDITTLTASTAADLELLVDSHLERHYPDAQDEGEDAEPAGMG